MGGIDQRYSWLVAGSRGSCLGNLPTWQTSFGVIGLWSRLSLDTLPNTVSNISAVWGSLSKCVCVCVGGEDPTGWLL